MCRVRVFFCVSVCFVLLLLGGLVVLLVAALIGSGCCTQPPRVDDNQTGPTVPFLVEQRASKLVAPRETVTLATVASTVTMLRSLVTASQLGVKRALRHRSSIPASVLALPKHLHTSVRARAALSKQPPQGFQQRLVPSSTRSLAQHAPQVSTVNADELSMAGQLCASAAAGDIAALQALIDGGADVNSKDYDARTACLLYTSPSPRDRG